MSYVLTDTAGRIMKWSHVESTAPLEDPSWTSRDIGDVTAVEARDKYWDGSAFQDKGAAGITVSAGPYASPLGVVTFSNVPADTCIWVVKNNVTEELSSAGPTWNYTLDEAGEYEFLLCPLDELETRVTLTAS
jgi:hypothetical protein